MSTQPSAETEALYARASHDAAAMESLLLARYDKIQQYVQYRLNRHLKGLFSSEDLVQDVCMLAIRHRKTFVPRGPGSFDRWLITITRNHLFEVFRMHSAMRRDRAREVRANPGSTTSGTPGVAAIPSAQTSPSSIAARREFREALADSIGTLKPDYRRALELRYLRGLSLAQTAEEMGKTTAAIQMLCHRAMAELRETLGSRSKFFS